MMVDSALAIDGGSSRREFDWPIWPPPLDDQQRALVWRVLEGRRWGAGQGGECDHLVQEFAAYHGATHGIAVVNGTMALFVALRAMGIGPGDEVIMPSYTFIACATATILAGARPVLVDVSAEHLHMTADGIRPALTPRTKAIMVVHIAGSPAPMADILSLADEYSVRVIEDSAQAHGAKYRGSFVGSLGDVATFSFQSSKAMTAGEGGILLTNDDVLANQLWSICNVGRSRGGAWYSHPEVGWNLRMGEIQAAILRPWLPRLRSEISTREHYASAMARELVELSLPVRVVPDPEGTTLNSRHLLILKLDSGANRKWVARALEAEGLPVDLGYPDLASVTSLKDAVVAHATPELNSVRDRLLWIRQSQMMSGTKGVGHSVRALERVLRDDRAITR